MLSAKKQEKGKISFRFVENITELTVCKSRLNRIKAINPEPIASGASDTNASSFPYKSPGKINFLSCCLNFVWIFNL